MRITRIIAPLTLFVLAAVVVAVPVTQQPKRGGSATKAPSKMSTPRFTSSKPDARSTVRASNVMASSGQRRASEFADRSDRKSPAAGGKHHGKGYYKKLGEGSATPKMKTRDGAKRRNQDKQRPSDENPLAGPKTKIKGNSLFEPQTARPVDKPLTIPVTGISGNPLDGPQTGPTSFQKPSQDPLRTATVNVASFTDSVPPRVPRILLESPSPVPVANDAVGRPQAKVPSTLVAKPTIFEDTFLPPSQIAVMLDDGPMLA